MATVNVRVTLPDEDAVHKFVSAMREIGAEVEAEVEEDEVISWEDAKQIIFSGKTREQIAGGTLRAAREKAGLTQTQLGSLVGISKHNISKMEHGERTITPERAQQYAEALNRYFKIDYKAFL